MLDIKLKLPIMKLEEEAREEVYLLIDKYYKKLDKKQDGAIDISKIEIYDNDIDALRHSYVSGVYTMEYNETVANFLGWVNELVGDNTDEAENMDFWNNAVGRKYGKRSKTREELFQKILKALKNGELITNPKDSRKYRGKIFTKTSIKNKVIVLQESETGENLTFLDLEKMVVLSREEFVAKIKKGEYGGEYEIRIIKGVEVPTSKRDGVNNLG